MKYVLIASLFVSTGSFAQSLDVKGFKTLLSQKQSVLEKVYQGMSKKMITKYKLETDNGLCDMTLVSDQTVLKVEGEKIIVHASDAYQTAASTACAGIEGQNSKSIFFEDKPSLKQDLADLDAIAAQVKSISKVGDLVTMTFTAETQNVTVKYDLSKSSFRNTLLIQDSSMTVTTSDLSDVDVNQFDLTDILFCESAESDNCTQGNWSDILY